MKACLPSPGFVPSSLRKTRGRAWLGFAGTRVAEPALCAPTVQAPITGMCPLLCEGGQQGYLRLSKHSVSCVTFQA